MHAEELARQCVEARGRISRAGRELHDCAGGLLAAAGLRLQLMEDDYPEAAERLREVSSMLEQAMESVRSVSRDLNPSRAFRVGLKRSLETLGVPVDYRAAATIPPETAEALYDAVAAATDAARRAGASYVNVRVSGDKGLMVRIEDDGAAKGRARRLGTARLLAEAAGLGFVITTGKRTIVLFRVYVPRRRLSR